MCKVTTENKTGNYVERQLPGFIFFADAGTQVLFSRLKWLKTQQYGNVARSSSTSSRKVWKEPFVFPHISIKPRLWAPENFGHFPHGYSFQKPRRYITIQSHYLLVRSRNRPQNIVAAASAVKPCSPRNVPLATTTLRLMAVSTLADLSRLFVTIIVPRTLSLAWRRPKIDFFLAFSRQRYEIQGHSLLNSWSKK